MTDDRQTGFLPDEWRERAMQHSEWRIGQNATALVGNGSQLWLEFVAGPSCLEAERMVH